MIDRKARDQGAELLRQFLAGTITNFHLENSWPSSADPGVRAIEDTLWCFYDDFKEHTMRGEWKLSQEQLHVPARWVVFLHSDEEYQWPKIRFPGIRPLQSGWFSRLTGVSKWRERKEATFMRAGDFVYWPFISKASFEAWNRHPKLMSGAKS